MNKYDKIQDVYREDDFTSLSFTELTDVPSSYSGQALKALRVNSATTALEFYTPTDANDAAIWGNITGTLSNQTDLQTALNAKANSLSGTVNEIAYFNAATTIASLAVATYPSLTELSYVKGVTSAIQTQLDTKEVTLTFGDGLTRTANDVDVDAAQPGITTATALPWTGLKTGTDGEIPTFDASGNPAFVAVGTATHVLTSNGAGAAPTFQVAAGGGTAQFIYPVPMNRIGDSWETQDNGGSGTVTQTAGAWRLATGTTDGSAARVRVWTPGAVGTSETLFDRNPSIAGLHSLTNDTSTAFISYFIMVNNGQPAKATGAITFDHFGFILDTTVLNASTSDGTTQTMTDISSGVTVTTVNTYYAKATSGTDVKFYVDKTLKTTKTTNLPDGAMVNLLRVGMANDSGVTTDRQMDAGHMTLSWDAV